MTSHDDLRYAFQLCPLHWPTGICNFFELFFFRVGKPEHLKWLSLGIKAFVYFQMTTTNLQVDSRWIFNNLFDDHLNSLLTKIRMYQTSNSKFGFITWNAKSHVKATAIYLDEILVQHCLSPLNSISSKCRTPTQFASLVSLFQRSDRGEQSAKEFGKLQLVHLRLLLFLSLIHGSVSVKAA